MAAKDTDTHEVLVGHLRGLITVLDAAYGLSLAGDLERRYRNLEQGVRPSRLTQALEDNLGRFEAYLQDAELSGREEPVVVDE